MLQIDVTTAEVYDEANDRFVPAEQFTLDLEHSLVSVSKWESHFEKPFLGASEKSQEEIYWYILAMIQTPKIPEDILQKLSKENLDQINAYINAKMTATTIRDDPKAKSSREIITSEVIYYWMVSLNIPWEAQEWHLNRLLTLIRVCNLKNQPAKKMSKQEVAQQQRDLNARRRAQLNTRG